MSGYDDWDAYRKAIAECRTVKDFGALVTALADFVHDDEVAHGFEDALRHRALTLIAEGVVTGAEAAELARIALTTSELDFSRWCA